jgi:beta-lactam-binding protein with PASTA domain
MRQAPDSGQRLSPGGTVTVWVGQDTRVSMPLVTGQTEDEASGVLRNAGVVAPPIVDVMPGEGEPLDSIVRQAPYPGTLVWPQTRAVLTLARLQPMQQDSPSQPPQLPRRLARVPWVVGLDSATAIRTLAGQGLRNYQIRLPPGGRTEDVVAAQSPDSGGRVPFATRVMLALRARQADSVFVPLVIGLTVDSARSVLDEAGLGTRVDALGGEALVGRARVRTQQPDVGTIVPAGTTVTIAPANVLAVILVIALLLGGGAVAARALCPTPTIAQLVRLYPAQARVMLRNESLVVASVSLRSHVEHRGAGLDITGSLLA